MFHLYFEAQKKKKEIIEPSSLLQMPLTVQCGESPPRLLVGVGGGGVIKTTTETNSIEK